MKRRLAIVRFVTLMVGLVVLVAVSYRQQLWALVDLETRHAIIASVSRQTAPTLQLAADVAVSPRVANRVGVNVFLDQEASLEARRKSFEMLRAAGIGWIRQQIPWKEVERDGKGDFFDRKWNQSSWASYDSIVDLAAEYGIDIIARVDTSPAWARPGGDWERTPPVNLEDLGDFLTALATRYRGRVRAYQVWNEPNLAIEWGQAAPDPAVYTRMLATAYRRLKAADPNALVLSASMAPTLEESDRALNELKFLEGMYDAGAKGSFDVLGVQAYGLRGGPDDHRLSAGDVNFSRTMLVRSLMVRRGDATRPIWATEMGWNAQPPDFDGPVPYGAVSDQLQAKYTVRAFERARSEWPWMGVMAVWFFKLPAAWEPVQPWHFFRMLDPDFTPHAIYLALSDYGRQDATDGTPSRRDALARG